MGEEGWLGGHKGDEHQYPRWKAGESRGSFGRPLQQHINMEWVEHAKGVQKLRSLETWRTGEPCMAFLRDVFGEEAGKKGDLVGGNE